LDTVEGRLSTVEGSQEVESICHEQSHSLLHVLKQNRASFALWTYETPIPYKIQSFSYVETGSRKIISNISNRTKYWHKFARF
jgi:hypothetical protein